MKRKSGLMLILALMGVLCTSAFAVTWTYYTHQAPTVIHEIPFASSFKAYQGETVTFNTSYGDPDKKVDDSCPPNTEYYTGSPFEQHWTISGEGSFSSSDPDVTTKDTNGLNSGNVYVYIGSGFSGSDSITVSVTLDDDSTNGPPGSDNDGDSAHSKGWTITVKDKCPTSLACISPSPCTGDKTAPATYGYRYDPDIAPTGRPDYTGITVHESFGSVTSNINKDAHVTAAGRTAYPSWGNDEWRDFYFGTPSSNGTFTPNASDVIYDQHGGFSNTTQYLVQPPPSDLTYDKPQTYTCQSASTNLNQSYTIRRKLDTSGNLYINKFGSSQIFGEHFTPL